MVKIIIDGYNFIFAVGEPGTKQLQGAREELCLRLQKYLEKKEVEIEVVFDSSGGEYFPSGSSQGGLKVTFCDDADDYIRNRVSKSPSPASFLVVTSDWEIVRDVKRNGAKVKSPSEFDALLNKSGRLRKVSLPCSEKPSPESMGKEEVAAWLEAFKGRERK